MATQAGNLVRTTVADDGSESYWVDQTVYDAGGIPARNLVAIAVTAYKVDQNSVETALEVTPDDVPENATEFTTENGVDGYHKYNFVIIPRWLVGTTYNRYDLVWSESEEAWYEYVFATPSSGNLVTNPTYFSVVTDPTTKIANVGTAQESGNLIYQVIGKIVTYQTSVCNLKAHALAAKEDCDCGCGEGDCGCDGKLSLYKTRIRNLFATMTFNEVQQLWLEGEKNARLAERYCDDCGCLSR